MLEQDYHFYDCLIVCLISLSMALILAILHLKNEQIIFEINQDIEMIRKICKWVIYKVSKLFTGQNPDIPREPPA